LPQEFIAQRAALGISELQRMSYSVFNEGVVHVFIKPAQLGINGLLAQTPLPLYVSEYALVRMFQRLDTEPQESIIECLTVSFQKMQIINPHKGEGLMVIYLQEIKVGYLKLFIRDGMVIVKTFLFLTNNGTPEGNKLGNLLHLSKADKSYWEIDKVSTFEQSDIYESTELKEIFIKAGCKSLFCLKANKRDRKESNKRLHIANMLSVFIHKSDHILGELKC